MQPPPRLKSTAAMSELALLEKVELRIALANDDKQLENALKLYLAPVLLKLSSLDGEVRKAVLKIVQHVIPRITAARSIKLPVDALLDQVKCPKVPKGSDPLSVRLYSLLFIVRGLERLDEPEKQALIPRVIDGISLYSEPVKARLFHILCKLLSVPKIPEELTLNTDDEKTLAQTISKFFMLAPTSESTTSVLPGLTTKDVTFFNQDAGTRFNTSADIHKVKALLLEFLKNSFGDDSAYIPLLVASADSSSAINEPAESRFRRLKVDIQKSPVMDQLLRMFVGADAPAISPILQERIVTILLKNLVSSNIPYLDKVVEIGLNSSNAKLKAGTVKLIQMVSKTSSDEPQLLGLEVLEQLRSNIMGMGWPKMEISAVKNYSNALAQRALEYEAFGNILYSNTSLLGNELENVEFLLKSLHGEDSDVRPTIQDCLSSLTSELTKIGESSKKKLIELARKYFEDLSESAHSCRFIIIKYIIAVFPFDDPDARIFCIMGTSTENRLDTIEEARKGLHPYWFSLAHNSTNPNYSATHDLLGMRNPPKIPSFDSVVNSILENEDNLVMRISMDNAIQFAVRILVTQISTGKKTVVVVDEEWAARVDKSVETDEQIRSLLRSEIAKYSTYPNAFTSFLKLLSNAFVGQFTNSFPRSEVFGLNFVHLISLSDSDVLKCLVESLDTYVEVLGSQTLPDSLSSQICQVLGVIGTHHDAPDSWVTNVVRSLSTSTGAHTKSYLLATAHIVSRIVLRDRLSTLLVDTLDNFVNRLIEMLGSENTYYTAIQCFSQMAIYGVFNPTLGLVCDARTKIDQILQTISSYVKKGDERSIVALSKLGLIVPESFSNPDSPLTDIENLIFNTHISKLIDILFTSGEAFLILGAGWSSGALYQQLDVQGEELKYISTTTIRLSVLLDFILKSAKSTKPSLRKACCIWLLSVVQYCKDQEDIKKRAAEIHVAFMRFLVDRDDLVQELASRGLSMIYDLGDNNLKETLVKGLLKSFTDTNATQSLSSGSLDLETELFAPNLMKTDDGSVSTYKDVLTLASDVGDPSLVYKFMSLAKSSALWSSRKGMAFGLGSVMSKTSLNDQLSNNKEMANKLIPRLYRYRYDPSTGVSQSMNDIWNSLVEDPNETIKSNFEIILNELLKEIGNKEWRVRQGSVTALTDLLQTTSIDQYEGRMEEIWSMSFRALDDIKESVRKAGTKLTRSLATSLTRVADVSTGSSETRAVKVLEDLIPFLIGNQGLLSDAEDVRNFSLDTIFKLCKVAGTRIKPFVPMLLDNFISMMSTIEPEVVNYLVLNADKYNLNSNDIDAQRLQSLGRSPMMDSIESLLENLDEEMMPKVVESLITTVKKSVGLPSKVCGSRVLVALTQKHLQLAKPFGDKLLQCAISQIYDRNETVSSSYAAAAGYLCRISSVNLVVAYGNKLNELYFESEDEKHRHIIAVASEAVSKYAGDKFETVIGAFLPLCFIGKHDVVSKVSLPFEREWVENTSGNSAMKVYFEEIVDLAESQINSPSYTIRRIIAHSIAKICEVVGDYSTVSQNPSKHLISILMEACKGKSWDGKEVIYGALVSTSIRLKTLLQDDDMQFAAVCKIVTTESKRRNKEYQVHAIKLTGQFIRNFPEENIIETYITVIDSFLWPSHDDDSDSDVDMEDTTRYNARQNIKLEEDKLALIENVFEAMNTNDLHDGLCLFALESVVKLFTSDELSITWRSKRFSNDWITSFLQKLLTSSKSLSVTQAKQLRRTWNVTSDVCLQKSEIEAVQIQSLRCTKEVRKVVQEVLGEQDCKLIDQKLDDFEQSEISSVIRAELSKTRSI